MRRRRVHETRPLRRGETNLSINESPTRGGTSEIGRRRDGDRTEIIRFYLRLLFFPVIGCYLASTAIVDRGYRAPATCLVMDRIDPRRRDRRRSNAHEIGRKLARRSTSRSPQRSAGFPQDNCLRVPQITSTDRGLAITLITTRSTSATPPRLPRPVASSRLSLIQRSLAIAHSASVIYPDRGFRFGKQPGVYLAPMAGRYSRPGNLEARLPPR